jgi:hypothetical protein
VETTTWQAFWERVRDRSAVRVERSMYRRVQAPMLCRSGGLALFAEYHHGGKSARVRAYTDEPCKEGQLLELELVTPGEAHEPLVVRGKVRWIDRLTDDYPARYDVGLDVLPLSQQDHDRLSLVLL